MSRVRTHFEDRAASLSDRATIETVEQDGAVTVTLHPRNPTAVGVVLYLYDDEVGRVALNDPACAPAELGDDPAADSNAVDYFINLAVEGRATAFHLGRGGCVEVRDGEKASRSWHNAWSWPGWRRRARRIGYEPYS